MGGLHRQRGACPGPHERRSTPPIPPAEVFDGIVKVDYAACAASPLLVSLGKGRGLEAGRWNDAALICNSMEGRITADYAHMVNRKQRQVGSLKTQFRRQKQVNGKQI